MESPNYRILKTICHMTDEQMALVVNAHFNELSTTTDLMNFGPWLETVFNSYNDNFNNNECDLLRNDLDTIITHTLIIAKAKKISNASIVFLSELTEVMTRDNTAISDELLRLCFDTTSTIKAKAAIKASKDIQEETDPVVIAQLVQQVSITYGLLHLQFNTHSEEIRRIFSLSPRADASNTEARQFMINATGSLNISENLKAKTTACAYFDTFHLEFLSAAEKSTLQARAKADLATIDGNTEPLTAKKFQSIVQKREGLRERITFLRGPPESEEEKVDRLLSLAKNVEGFGGALAAAFVTQAIGPNPPSYNTIKTQIIHQGKAQPNPTPIKRTREDGDNRDNPNKRQKGKKENHQPKKRAPEYDLDDYTRSGRCRKCFKPGHGVSGCDKPDGYRPEKTCNYCWEHHRSIANTHSTSECNKKKKGVPVRRQKKTSFNNPLDDSDEYSD